MRLKEDIRELARLSNDVGIYSFKYIWGGRERVGVMAQEIEKNFPEAVADMGSHLAVNYDVLQKDPVISEEMSQLGLQFNM